jgi:hypothetical protein
MRNPKTGQRLKADLDSLGLNALIEALEDILSQVGSKYQITFA